MQPRERVLTALSRRVPDRVPRTMSLCPSQVERFRRETGAEHPAKYFGFEVRSVGPREVARHADFTRYLGPLPPDARIDEWGIAWVRGSEFTLSA